MKTEQELRAKLAELLAMDPWGLAATFGGPDPAKLVFSKVAACKTMLWALGENDDDHWHITAAPGPPIRTSPYGGPQCFPFAEVTQ